MPDPMRFDTRIGGGLVVAGVVFDDRVCMDCGHGGRAFTFILWWWSGMTSRPVRVQLAA